MAKALVVYTTRTGNTKTIAESIADGLREAGAEVKIIDGNEVTSEAALSGYDAYLFGSATYHADMMQSMKNVLFIAERANLAGKVGGAFGAYGWSGEAPRRIYDTMKNLYRMDMVDTALRIQVPGSSERLKQASQKYGKEAGDKTKA
jgi:flavorubredoxin